MKKSLISILIILAMCASLTVPAFGAEQPSYTYSSVKFGYVENDVWRDATALEPGKDLVAKINVENTGAKGDLVFALLLYNDNAIVAVDAVTKEANAGKTDFALSVKLPADVSKCYASTVLTDSVSKMSFVSPGGIFPGGSCDLVSLSVNGKAIEDFKYDKYEYSYDIPYDTKTPPAITYIAEDGSAKVEVEKPELFPGKSVITVSKPGLETKTYTVKYNSIAVENVRHGKDAITAESTEGVTPKLELVLENGSPCWTDRDNASMIMSNVSEEVAGLPYIRGALNWQNGGGQTYWEYYNSTELLCDWYEFDIKRSSNVMILLSGSGAKTEKFASEHGWTISTKTTSTGYLQAYAGSTRTYNKMLSKYIEVPDGEVVTVRVPNLSDGYVPITVIQAGTYDPDPIDVATELKSLTVDGKGVDLVRGVYNYSVEIPANQDEIPVVEAVANGEMAEVTVTKTPVKFPGSTELTVAMEGAETRTYTINYTTKAVDGLKANPKAVTNSEGKETLSVALRNNLQVGVPCWNDRLTNVNMTFKAVDESIAGEDYIIGNLVWSQESLSQPISSYWAARVEPYTNELIGDWVSFNLKRSATVKVIYGTEANHKADHIAVLTNAGYKKTANNSGFLKPYVSSEQIYTNMLSKHYTVGDEPVKVEIPNFGATKSYACFPYVIVIDYDDYGEEIIDPEPEPEPDPEPEPTVPPTELKTLTVDGGSVEVKSGVYEYTVEIPANQNTAPTVEGKANDAEAVATVTETPVKFPGKSVVTVTKDGAETKTYTINYTAKPVSGVKVNEKAAKNASGEVVRSVELRSGLNVGSPCWNDRLTNANMTMKAVDSSIAGEDYIIGNLAWSQESLLEPISSYWAARVEPYTDEFIEDWVSFELNRSAHVKVIYGNNEWHKDDHLAYFARKGYTETTNSQGFLRPYVTSEQVYTKMLTRHYTVDGDEPRTVKIPNLGATRGYGCFSYVIVIDYDEYGESFEDPEEIPEPVVIPTELKSLTVDGTEVTLKEGVYEYDVTIPANQVSVPVTEGVANNEEATVTEVSAPEKFPGTSVIEVTLDGEETTTYTLNYKAELAGGLTANEKAVKNAEGAVVRSVQLRNNLQVGVPCWNDRLTNANMVMKQVDSSVAGEDYIIGNLVWSQESLTQPISSYWAARVEPYTNELIGDWISFDLARSATVKVLYSHDTWYKADHIALLTDAGFEKSTNNSYYLTAYCTSDIPYMNMLSKHYDVTGDTPVKVEIPNLGATKSYACYSYVIVIDYDEYQ